MSRHSWRSDSDWESDNGIRVSRRPSPAPIRRVRREGPTIPQPRYIDDPRLDDRFLIPAGERTVVTTRRSRSHDRRDSSPVPPPSAPQLVINNRIYKYPDSHSDSDSESEPDSSRNKSRHRRRPRSSSSSSGYSKEREHREREAWALQHARQDFELELERERRERERERKAAQKDFDLERTQKELEELKLVAKIEQEEKRRERTAREERELREAKKELDAIRERKERDELERRVKQKLELDRLKEEEAALAEKKRREKEAMEAVEKYKKQEAERIAKEKAEAAKRDAEYKQRMQEHLLKSGLDEKEINAILEGKKIEKEKKEKQREIAHRTEVNIYEDRPRPTYTRMARRHLSLETLRLYDIDYVLDQVSIIALRPHSHGPVRCHQY